MTDMDDTDSTLKQLRAEFTQFHDQLQHMFAINQYQRQLMYGWLMENGQEDSMLLGLSLTDHWQSRTEKRLDRRLCRLRNKLP